MFNLEVPSIIQLTCIWSVLGVEAVVIGWCVLLLIYCLILLVIFYYVHDDLYNTLSGWLLFNFLVLGCIIVVKVFVDIRRNLFAFVGGCKQIYK